MSFIRKCFHFSFQLYTNSIFMPIILSEFFQKNLQYYQLFYVILNFHIHVRWKASLYAKITTLLFQLYSKCICMPSIVSECISESFLQFYQWQYVTINFIIHMFYKNFQFFKKISAFHFSFVFKMHLYE